MTRNAHTAPAHVQFAKALDQFPDVLLVARLGENALLLRHVELLIHQPVENAIHSAPEGKRIILGKIGLMLVKILIHIDKPTVFQADAPFVDQIEKARIRTQRAIGHDHDRRFAALVVALDQLGHFHGHLPIQINFRFA